MKVFLLTLLASVMLSGNLRAQNDTARNPGAIVPSADTTTINAADTGAFVDNTLAVDLIRQARTEDMTFSMKEVLLKEQLASLTGLDAGQRKALERQLKGLLQADSIRRARQEMAIDSLKRIAQGAPVVLRHDTIYYVYTNLGSFTPRERAAINSEKILQTAKAFSLKNDSLYVLDNGSSSDIMYGEIALVSVTDLDAAWMNTTRDSLATVYQSHIVESVKAYKKAMGLPNMLKLAGLTLLVLAMQFALYKAVNHLFRRVIDKKIGSRKWAEGVKVKNIELLTPAKQTKVLLFLSKLLRYGIYILLLYLTIPLLFSIFPGTKGLAHVLFGWLVDPVKSIAGSFIGYLPKMLRIIVIVIITHYFIKLLRYAAGEIASGRISIPGFYADWAKATFNILRIFIYAFMLVLIFPLLPDSDTDIFKGVSVFLGLIFSLGSTTVIANLVAGIVITYMRPFKIGDRVKVGDVFGDVIEKTPFVIRVKTHKKEVVTVPNSTMLTSNVVNYSTSALEEGVILYTTITVGYEVPWDKVEALLITAARKTEYILAQPEPFVLHLELTDFSVSYQLCAYTRDPHLQAQIYSAMNRNIQDAFRDAGIEMTTMHYMAVRDGNKSTVPDQPKANPQG